MEIRKAAFAGSWYPQQAAACKKEIRQYLTDAPAQEDSGPWLAGIVPHAGWFYSGRIACGVIDRLKDAEPIDLVVVFGMHLHFGSPNYMMAEGAWETPFGELPVAGQLAEALKGRFEFQLETPHRFIQDNTVELQLPFIKYLLDPSEFLAIGAPPAPASLDIGRAVVDWARGNNKRFRIIGSTDLTHYGPNYGFTPHGRGKPAVAWVRDQNDRRMIETMLAMAPERVLEEGLRNQNACCAGAAATVIAAARHCGATRSQSIAYASSFEKSPGDSFVGYAGLVFGL
ncbi:MAG: AmmeMemoRadiSam system protein B [Desulfobacteraceae bacterium]|nr:MAG: AmmeMemoRadiSam system protein B [Desulfobacteraceae bacterium]